MAKNQSEFNVDECIEECESLATEANRKAGYVANEGEEFENRSTILSNLKSATKPTSGVFTKHAFDMVDYYCSTELNHNHNSKNEIVLKSIKQEWARKAIRTIANKLEGAWSSLHEDAEEQPKNNKLAKTEKAGSLKERAIATGKKALTKTLVRKASRNMVSAGQQAVVALLAQNSDLADPGLREKVAMFLATDLGRAGIAGLLSVGLEYMPGIPDDIKESLVEELQTEAADSATMPVENLIKMAFPMLLSSVAPLLGAGDSNSETKLLDMAAAAAAPAVPVATPSNPTVTPTPAPAATPAVDVPTGAS